MIGKLLKGAGGATAAVAKGLGGALSQSAGVGNFTAGLGKSDEGGASRKASDAVRKVYDASSTEVLQRIFSEVKDIHKIIASQIVPASEENEIARDKKVKDKEVLLALEDLRPTKEKVKVKKKEPWWKTLWAWILPFIKWIINPLNWVKWLLKIPFIASLGLLAVSMAAFFLTPLGLTLLAIGFIAINWKAIKATIKEYVAKIRGWVKTALSFVGLGWMMETEEEKKARLKQEVQAELEAQQERIDEGTAHPSEVIPDETGMDDDELPISGSGYQQDAPGMDDDESKPDTTTKTESVSGWMTADTRGDKVKVEEGVGPMPVSATPQKQIYVDEKGNELSPLEVAARLSYEKRKRIEGDMRVAWSAYQMGDLENRGGRGPTKEEMRNLGFGEEIDQGYRGQKWATQADVRQRYMDKEKVVPVPVITSGTTSSKEATQEDANISQLSESTAKRDKWYEKTWKGLGRKKLRSAEAFIIHHTGDSSVTADDVVKSMTAQGISVHYIIDREGQTWQWLPNNMRGAHMGTPNKFAQSHDLSNDTVLGVEIAASQDNAVTTAQIASAISLVQHLGFGKNRVFAHPEVRDDKSRYEGMSVIQTLRGGLVPPQGMTEKEMRTWRKKYRSEIKGVEDAGNFQTGGMIPKGKVGLAGEGKGQESVGGQMLEGPTLVSGGEKGTRVKRETPSRNDMMGSLSQALGEAPPDPRDIPRGPYSPPSDPSRVGQPEWFSKSPFFKDTPNPWWKNELFDNIPAGPPSYLPEGSSGYNVVAKVFDKRRKKAKEAVGWDIGPLSGGMLWAARTMMSRRVKAHEGLGFDAGSLSKGNLWRAKVMQKREAAGGTKGQIWQAKTMAKRAGDSENWKNYIMEMAMVDTGHHGMMKETLQYKNPDAPRVDTTLQQAGQLGSMVIVNNSTEDNSASFSSTQSSNMVGTSQMGIALTDSHAQAVGGISI